jgi:hypothetical protein
LVEGGVGKGLELGDRSGLLDWNLRKLGGAVFSRENFGQFGIGTGSNGTTNVSLSFATDTAEISTAC